MYLSKSVSEKIVERIAEAKDTEPSEIDESLFAAVDTDSLNSLFASRENGPTRNEGEVQFPYNGFIVTVTAQGEVTLEG
ncbi:HalOD1 output domain-containing protein [Halorubrum sp. FL23]|uniref:HalOD1 output domain-containing protein n=1 Tax=Halorubrum sp. FL23 TaxID=3458704 RepID=UPI004034E4D8